MAQNEAAPFDWSHAERWARVRMATARPAVLVASRFCRSRGVALRALLVEDPPRRERYDGRPRKRRARRTRVFDAADVEVLAAVALQAVYAMGIVDRFLAALITAPDDAGRCWRLFEMRRRPTMHVALPRGCWTKEAPSRNWAFRVVHDAVRTRRTVRWPSRRRCWTPAPTSCATCASPQTVTGRRLEPIGGAARVAEERLDELFASARGWPKRAKSARASGPTFSKRCSTPSRRSDNPGGAPARGRNVDTLVSWADVEAASDADAKETALYQAAAETTSCGGTAATIALLPGLVTTGASTACVGA